MFKFIDDAKAGIGALRRALITIIALQAVAIIGLAALATVLFLRLDAIAAACG